MPLPQTTSEIYRQSKIDQGIFNEDGEPALIDIDNINLIEEPYNPLDPVVIFDKEQEKPTVPLNSTQNDETNDNNNIYDSTKEDGIKTPILLINSMIINPILIDSLTLNCEGFMPTLEIKISDPNRQLDSIGSPGLANVVYLIVTHEFNGLYRPITLAFYIKERINGTSTNSTYYCEFRHLTLNNELCDQIGNKPLTTFELFNEVAKMCSLGFAEGPENACKNINDAKNRFVYSQKLSDYLELQLGQNANEANAIFDAWIDPHGYIVLVNIAAIFNADINPRNLVIAEKTGMGLNTLDDISGPEHYMPRLLSNYPDIADKSLMVDKYYPYMDASYVQNDGTVASYYYLTSVGKKNLLVQQDVNVIDESVEGIENTQVYEFTKLEYIGADQRGTGYLISNKIHNKWLSKKNSKILVVEMTDINLGLERGTLINLIVNESDPNLIAQQLKNQENAVFSNKYTDQNEHERAKELTSTPDGQQKLQGWGNTMKNNQSEEFDEYDQGDTAPTKGAAMQENTVAPNVVYSGIYYINGIRYKYTKTGGKFYQILFLIKLGFSNQLFSFSAGERNTNSDKGIIENNPNTDIVSDAYEKAKDLFTSESSDQKLKSWGNSLTTVPENGTTA